MTVFKPSKFKTGASNQASATATSTVGANTPITVQIEDFEIALSSSLTEDADYTIADLEDLVPDIANSLKSLFAKFNVPVVADAVALQYKHDRQEIYRAICFAHGDGLVVKLGDYQILIAEDVDITSKPYSFSGHNGGVLTIDKGGVNLPARCFVSRQYVKDTRFEAQMDILVTASELSEYLDRGEPIISWSDMPKQTTVTVYSITPILDKDTQEVKGAKLLAENAEGEPIQLWAPGMYEDYAGLDFSEGIPATRDDSEFTIAERVLTIRTGGRYIKLHELGVGEHKVIGFESSIGQYGWQSTLTLADGRKVNGNKNVDRKLQSLKNPEGAISESTPAVLAISNIEEYTNKEGKQRHKITAQIMLAQDDANPLLTKLKARAAAASKKKAPAMVGNPL